MKQKRSADDIMKEITRASAHGLPSNGRPKGDFRIVCKRFIPELQIQFN